MNLAAILATATAMLDGAVATLKAGLDALAETIRTDNARLNQQLREIRDACLLAMPVMGHA